MTAILAQPAADRTYEICDLLVHTDLADNNFVEEGLKDENVKDETENENAGGWQPELIEKGKVVYGRKSLCEARGREIGLTADHGMYDIVPRSAARGKLVRAKWLDDRRKNGMRSRLVAQQFNWAKRDDAAQNTPPLVAARLLVSVAFYHALRDEGTVVVLPKGLCLH